MSLNEMTQKLEIYPNPANEILNVLQVGKKQIFDMNGMLVLESNEEKMNIHALKPGVYVLECNGERNKIVKQ